MLCFVMHLVTTVFTHSRAELLVSRDLLPFVKRKQCCVPLDGLCWVPRLRSATQAAPSVVLLGAGLSMIPLN